ncbi:MAG: flagellar motor switch protein FliG [Dehalococcoidia bacterium]|nr:MAG: flagellar motor switch protein FliG [bacterium]MCE7929030.1 flagellar motor switch protein FliG [Chloroflexi bacterium CFX7]MCK6565302.1 flagellar motor switch protein FliG [Dehalococcoidia bacterium]MCL4230453.1 flagellar motor switch protein FliG [Dehalococcoidia bacterium]NUQ56382.1 flagellar motor switch protein FliG [Dehalococcoidia bacterium]
MTASREEKLSGRRKAAALIITLGKERSAEVLRHLSDEDIERLTWEISAMGELKAEQRREVVTEFQDAAVARNVISLGGLEYAEDLLRLALGEDKASELIDRLSATSPTVPFGFLRHLNVQQLVNFLSNEHPQTIALLLSFLQAEKAAQVLSAMDPETAADVAQRIALMERANPDIVNEVEAVLRRKLSAVLQPARETQHVGGLEVLVNLLKQSSRMTEKTIIEALEDNEPELADEIKKRMFVFENVAALDDRSIQRILREVEVRDLALALKATPDTVKESILRNMSTRASAMLKEDMEASGPVRLRQVEEAQSRIVAVIRRLDDAEEIVIARGGDDELVG